MDMYDVFNATKNISLASETEWAGSLWARMKGLLGRSLQDFQPGRGLLISPSQGIHTIGMKFPIDVAYLDPKGRILKLYHQLVPCRVAAVMPRAHSILELPPGTLQRTRTAVGDVLEIRPVTL